MDKITMNFILEPMPGNGVLKEMAKCFNIVMEFEDGTKMEVSLE